METLGRDNFIQLIELIIIYPKYFLCVFLARGAGFFVIESS